jgi:ribosomal protein S18 acetylase RimI-like enzyme
MAAITTDNHTIRYATESDVPAILALIHELAEYEKELASCRMTEEILLKTLSFPIPSSDSSASTSDTNAHSTPAFTKGYARTLLISPTSTPSLIAGLAIYFPNYSTWTGPGIYLEDLIITKSQRGKGYGKALLSALAREVNSDEINPWGMGRLQWSVLNWNKPSIDFYLSDSVGAFLKEEWLGCQVEGEKLRKLAEAGKSL